MNTIRLFGCLKKKKKKTKKVLLLHINIIEAFQSIVLANQRLPSIDLRSTILNLFFFCYQFSFFFHSFFTGCSIVTQSFNHSRSIISHIIINRHYRSTTTTFDRSSRNLNSAIFFSFFYFIFISILSSFFFGVDSLKSQLNKIILYICLYRF